MPWPWEPVDVVLYDDACPQCGRVRAAAGDRVTGWCPHCALRGDILGLLQALHPEVLHWQGEAQRTVAGLLPRHVGLWYTVRFCYRYDAQAVGELLFIVDGYPDA